MKSSVESIILLEAILKEKNLGVCFRSNTFHRGEYPKSLGIFPVEQLSLVYNPHTKLFEHLCPDHLPDRCPIAIDVDNMPLARCYPRSIFFYFNLTPTTETYFIP